ncbi:MAG: head GIN domain-containing protein [Bacteroidales bacterium]
MMKILWKAVTIFTFTIAGFIQLTPAQPVRQMEVPSFSKVEILGNFEVVLEESQKESISLIGQDDEVGRIKIAVKNGVLRISDAKSLNQRGEAMIVVKYVRLEKILASAGSLVYKKGEWKLNNLEITCSSGAKVDFWVNADQITAGVDKGGTLTLKGIAKAIDAEASTGGIFDAYELKCDSAIVRANTGGLAKVYATQYLQANAGAGGEISYRRMPKKLVPKKMLGGKVEQMIE